MKNYTKKFSFVVFFCVRVKMGTLWLPVAHTPIVARFIHANIFFSLSLSRVQQIGGNALSVCPFFIYFNEYKIGN